MPVEMTYPGVYVEELINRAHTIEGVATSITAFVGCLAQGPSNSPRLVSSFDEFKNEFGRPGTANALASAVDDFFANGGRKALIVRLAKNSKPKGLSTPNLVRYQAAFDALNNVNTFNLLCLPPESAACDIDAAILQHALSLCADRRAFLIVDPRSDWASPADVLDPDKGMASLGLHGDITRNAAVYFPRIQKADPALRRRTASYVPCGAIAGVMARTDQQRGVWKASAGTEAVIRNIQGLSIDLTDNENGQLNTLGLNCLRSFPGSDPVVWGARTLRGDDPGNDEYKYIPVRRLALFIEESLSRGLQWAVFEPNDEPLWAEIRQTARSFMHQLFRQGAFAGSAPRDAYFVKCDAQTTTQNDRHIGIVNIHVGFARLKPAEFVILKLQQKTASIQT